MASIIPFLGESVFDPDTTKAMGDAFDAACGHLGGRGQPLLVKEIVAKRIIEAARRGEHDPQRLCEEALDALGLNRLQG